MKEACIVPAYRRPEFLSLCLKRLAACEGIKSVLVRVAIDNHLDHVRGAQMDMEAARAARLPSIEISLQKPHRYHGNSFNVLKSYAQAVADGFERIYLVEEDVMVAPDFFLWQRAALAGNSGFCAVAAAKPHASIYASLGAGWRPENLARVLDHARPEYFSDMAGYCSRTFPDRRDGFCEQDGLIERVMARESAQANWSDPPRAFHIGYYGSNRGWRNPITGTWREKAEKIEAIWGDRERLRALNEHHSDSVEAVPA